MIRKTVKSIRELRAWRRRQRLAKMLNNVDELARTFSDCAGRINAVWPSMEQASRALRRLGAAGFELDPPEPEK